MRKYVPYAIMVDVESEEPEFVAREYVRGDDPLIAAAPDLLAACRLLLASLIDWCDVADPDDQRGDDYRAIDAAQAAIAKAEGRSDDAG